MKAFVQVQEDGEFYSENQFSAWRAFSQFGYEVIKFKRSELHRLDITRETPCCGGLSVMQYIFKLLKVEHNELSSYPLELTPFLGRKVGTSTLEAAVKKLSKGESLFIKPTDQNRKIFNGKVFDSESLDSNICALLVENPKMPVFVSEVVPFLDEYRVCIHNGSILGARPYKGNASLGYDFDEVARMVNAFENAPIAYCLDVGITMANTTLLIEVTDAYSFGHYGLSCELYGKMLIDRWNEITCNSLHG